MSSRGVLPECRDDRADEDPGDREESLGRDKPEESLIVHSILLRVKTLFKDRDHPVMALRNINNFILQCFQTNTQDQKKSGGSVDRSPASIDEEH